MSSENVAKQRDGGVSVMQEEREGMQSSGGRHKMSIALTIGATIALIGLILLLYGLFGNTSYSHSDGININLWWGLLMLLAGLLMAAGGYISVKKGRQMTRKG